MGVPRQDCGTAGKVESCQIGVSLRSPSGRVPRGCPSWLGRSWGWSDRSCHQRSWGRRRRRAGRARPRRGAVPPRRWPDRRSSGPGSTVWADLGARVRRLHRGGTWQRCQPAQGRTAAPARAGSWPHPRWGEGPASSGGGRRPPPAGPAPWPSQRPEGAGPLDARARRQPLHPAGAHRGPAGLGDHRHRPWLVGAAPRAGEGEPWRRRGMASSPGPGGPPPEPVGVDLEVFTDRVLGVHPGRGHRVAPPSLGWMSRDDPVAVVVSTGWPTRPSSTTPVDADGPTALPRDPLGACAPRGVAAQARGTPRGEGAWSMTAASPYPTTGPEGERARDGRRGCCRRRSRGVGIRGRLRPSTPPAGAWPLARGGLVDDPSRPRAATMEGTGARRTGLRGRLYRRRPLEPDPGNAGEGTSMAPAVMLIWALQPGRSWRDPWQR